MDAYGVGGVWGKRNFLPPKDGPRGHVDRDRLAKDGPRTPEPVATRDTDRARRPSAIRTVRDRDLGVVVVAVDPFRVRVPLHPPLGAKNVNKS